MLMIKRIPEELLETVGRRSTSAPSPQQSQVEEIGQQIKHWARETEKIIATHPGASLAAAVGLGIVLGWWVKRT